MDSPTPTANHSAFYRVPRSPSHGLSDASASFPHFDMSDAPPPVSLFSFPCCLPFSPPAVPYNLPPAQSLVQVAAPTLNPPATSFTQRSVTDHNKLTEKKRGRHKRQVTEEQRQAEFSERMERNRQLARENRKKKKAYVQTLEDQIKALKAELAACKKQLEDLDRSQSQNFFEFCTRIKEDAQKFERQHLLRMVNVLQNARVPEAMQLAKSAVEIKKKALDVLVKTVLDFLIPIPHRHFMHVAEREASSPEGPNASSIEDINRIVMGKEEEHKKDPDPEENWGELVPEIREHGMRFLLRTPEARGFVKETALKLRENLNTYMRSYESLTHQAISIDFFVLQRLASMLDPRHIGNFSRWLQVMTDQNGLGHHLLHLSGDEEQPGNFALRILRLTPPAIEEPGRKSEDEDDVASRNSASQSNSDVVSTYPR